MNSWDCFDTLVGRRYQTHHAVFDEVGRRLSIPNFKALRIDAEKKSNGTYIDIYRHLPGIDPSIEISVDLDHCFPILENINKVQDGDIIISDIYYSKEIVEKILKRCGLNKNVKFYVSPDGKRKGYVWKEVGLIKLHTGDNKKTDVKSPRNFGINSYHYTGSFFNETEDYISKTDLHLALWMRLVRLHCPYLDDHSKNIWEDQTNFNLPILALSSLELPDKKIAFTYRDSVFWKPIYEKLTGKQSVRFDSSRALLNNPTDQFKRYVKEHIEGCVIADLQGTGRSLLNFFSEPPEIYFIGGKLKDHPKLKSISGLRASAIEKHNCSDQGSLVGWNETGIIRANLEHDKTVISIQHSVFNTAIENIKYFNIQKNLDNLKYLLEKMKGNYTDTVVSWKENHI